MNEFNWPVRVYYEDTDTGGIVYYANYLKYFERARTEWLRHADVAQQLLVEQEGVIFVVKSTQIDYSAPAKLDDMLRICVKIEKLGLASIDFLQQAWHGERCLVTGRILVACVSRTSLRPCPIPAQVVAKITSCYN